MRWMWWRMEEEDRRSEREGRMSWSLVTGSLGGDLRAQQQLHEEKEGKKKRNNRNKWTGATDRHVAWPGKSGGRKGMGAWGWTTLCA